MSDKHQRRGLGRGLGSLIPTGPRVEASDEPDGSATPTDPGAVGTLTRPGADWIGVPLPHDKPTSPTPGPEQEEATRHDRAEGEAVADPPERLADPDQPAEPHASSVEDDSSDPAADPVGVSARPVTSASMPTSTGSAAGSQESSSTDDACGSPG